MEQGTSVLWHGGRYFNRLTISKRKIGLFSVRLLKTLKFQDVERILVGFSEDKQTMYIKQSNIGIKMSIVSHRANGRTFSASGLVSQFGNEVIGAYILESINEEDGIMELKKSK